MRNVKESCLHRMLLIGASSLHRAVSKFVLHYQTERNHRGLENQILRPEFPLFQTMAKWSVANGSVRPSIPITSNASSPLDMRQPWHLNGFFHEKRKVR